MNVCTSVSPRIPQYVLTQMSNETRYQECLGPVPPLLVPPAEAAAGEPDTQNQQISIQELLEVKPETNAVSLANICVHIWAKRH